MKKHLTFFLLVFLASCGGKSELDLAQTAFQAGDYETALVKFTSLANSGDVKAQYFLGLMYEREYGVDQDYAAAVQWYLKAAEQGLADAQIRLAQIYIKGV
ncbi:MAG: tetratricopeptide repeat protein, partial [Gammaproteobacteria bacterium]